jgi:tritrans,polycis-undecaprenyl-diphosphate synthase [geranylgeranyl-diphosphate specific]
MNMKLDSDNIPKHIGIIMDGNRRFAKRIMKNPWDGHESGAKKIQYLLEWCKEFDIKRLTLYTFSIENFNRPKKEFDHLMKLFKENFNKLKDNDKINEYGIRVRVIGRYKMFPKDVSDAIDEIVEKTKNNNKYEIIFAMAYGGRVELVDAIRKIAKKVENGKIKPDEIDLLDVEEHLYLREQPDLIIRTGGERRLSNFLTWQSVYSELYFIDKMWPEFDKDDFEIAISDYVNRSRRFGK